MRRLGGRNKERAKPGLAPGWSATILEGETTRGNRKVSFRECISTPENGVLSVTVVLPDGRRVVDGRTLKLQGDASEKRVATRNADGTWTLEWKPSSYSGPSVIDGGVVDPSFVAWKQERIAKGDTSVADPGNYARAVIQFAEEIAAAKETVAQGIGGAYELSLDPYNNIGGSPNASANGAVIWDPRSADYLADQAMHLYDASKPVPGLAQAEIQTLQYTAAGRLFLGVAQKAAVAIDDGAQLERLADMTAAATGIQKLKVLTYLRASSTAVGRVATVREMFNPSDASKGDPTLRSAFTQPNACGTTMTAVSVSMPNAGTVRLRFNYSTPDFAYHHGNVYLLGPSGSQISATPLVSGDFRHKLYIDIPLDKIADVLNITGESSDRFLDLRFKVALWEHAGDTAGIGGVNMSGTLSVNLKNRVQDLSTLPAGPQHDLENKILSALQFPLDGTAGANVLKSEAHTGDGLFALDLSGGTGTHVLSPAPSTIHQVDLFAGQLVLKHTLPSGQSWYTTFYHLTDILEGVSGVQYVGLQEALDDMSIASTYKTQISGAINSRHDAAKLDQLGLPADVKAQVQTVIDALLQAQSALETLVTQWQTTRTFTAADGALGAQGNEGASHGKHLHVQVNIGTMKGTPVDLSHWLNSKQQGITNVLNIDGRTSDMQAVWNDRAGALVNMQEHIAFGRANGDNIAYALLGDGTVGERVTYTKYQYRDASGALVSDEGWISLNPISGTRKIWTGSSWSTGILASIYDYASQTYVPLN